MVRSLTLATTVTLATLLLALPLALLLYRTRLPLRALWLGALCVPLLVPPYILGTGVMRLLTPTLAIGPTGAAVTMTLWLLPLPLLFLGAGLRLATREHEEAALLETTPAGVLRHVTLPMALPHVAAGALAVFVPALGEFGVPVLFQVRVYSGAIFTQFAAFYDFRQAAATALPLLAVIVPAVMLAERLWSNAERETTAEAPILWDPAATTPHLTLAAALLATLCLLPLLLLGGDVGSVASFLRALQNLGPQAWQTFLVALPGTAGALLVAFLLGWVATRLGVPGSRALLALQLPLFAVPAVIVGLGLIRLWNGADWRHVVYTSPAILILGYVARFTPLLVALLAASYRQLPREVDEAAYLDGAGPLAILARIHLPLLRPALTAAALLTFVLCVGEVPVSMLVAPAGHAPLAVRFFTLITNAPSEQVAALALVTTLLTLLPVSAWLSLATPRSEPAPRRR
jgi:iron(III) transport system permease protein